MERSATLAALVVLAAMAVAVLAAGCGAGASSSARDGESRFVVSGTENEQPSVPEAHPAHCGAAAVALAERGGAIQFQVQCAGPDSGGRAYFVVERYLPGDPARMRGPRRFAGALKTEAGSGEVRSGSCVSRRRVIQCRVEVSGSVTLAGAFGVKRRTACALAVSVIEVKAEPCDRDGCQGPVHVRELFDGRPAGC